MASSTDFVGCTYMVSKDFFEEYGIDIKAYTGVDPSDIPEGAVFPYRYDTEKLYGFCVPTFDGESDSVSALSDKAIETF